MSDTERMREALQELLASTECVHGYRFCRRCGFEGRLAVLAVPEQAPETPERLFRALEHGDATHRAWLRDAIGAFFEGGPIPPPVAAPAALPDGKDAERYRWLRDNWVRRVRSSADGPEYMALDYVWNVRVPNKYPSLDAAIDAGIQAQTEGERHD